MNTKHANLGLAMMGGSMLSPELGRVMNAYNHIQGGKANTMSTMNDLQKWRQRKNPMLQMGAQGGVGFNPANASPMGKVASAGGAVLGDIAASALGITGAALAAHGIHKGIQAISNHVRTGKQNEMIETIKKDPAIVEKMKSGGNKSDNEKLFHDGASLLQDYAPSVLENRVASRDFVLAYMNFPANSVQFAKTLAELQNSIDKGRLDPGSQMVTKAITDVAATSTSRIVSDGMRHAMGWGR